jgi:hypothetical protein
VNGTANFSAIYGEVSWRVFPDLSKVEGRPASNTLEEKAAPVNGAAGAGIIKGRALD